MRFFNRQRRWRSATRTIESAEHAARADSRRINAVRLAVVVLFSVLILQLARFQIGSSGHYQLQAESNRVRLDTVKAGRGLIYDRNHQPLVTNVASYSAVVIPANLPKNGEQDVYFRLSRVIAVPPDVIGQQVRNSLQKSDPFTPVTVKEQLDQATVLTLAELRHSLPGVDVRYSAVRQYTDGTLMSHIYGYVAPMTSSDYTQLRDRGYQLDDKIGKAGLEYTYEDQLRGTPGGEQVEVDASGRVLRQIAEVPPKPGNNLVLSIDMDLQQHVTDILQQSLNQYQSPWGAAIMMDVHTGEILAYVSLPNYDPNMFSGPVSTTDYQSLIDNPGKPLLDHAAADAYPPGSIFKVITGSAALQEGVANLNTTLTSRGAFSISNNPNEKGPGSVVYDWADLGTLDFLHGLAMSSDIYFYCLSGGCPTLPGGGIPTAQALGASTLAKYARDFGLGAKTGLDLPDETPGLIPTPEWKQATQKDDHGNPLPWVVGDTYFMGIGQGYDTATPIQMVRIAAALANGGDLLRPHIVHEVDDANGNVVVAPQREVVRHLAVSDQNLAYIRQGMTMAVEGGSAYTAFLPGQHIAGKTGTAEFGAAIKPAGDNTNGTYNEHGWFISFAPYDNPQVALVVFHQKGNGAATAAPTAKRIWDYYFNQYKKNPPTPSTTNAAKPTATGAAH